MEQLARSRYFSYQMENSVIYLRTIRVAYMPEALMNMLRAIAGLLLIPVCAALTRTVLSMIALAGAAAGFHQSLPILALGSGVLLWVVVYSSLPRPVRSYVLAHELTHALWGSLCGARVSGLKVSRQGGSVRVSEVNWVTALAPYFFPLYTVLAVLLYGVLALVWDLRRWELLWFGLIGLTLGFHWTFTLDTLARPQSDIRRYGRIFSYTMIYFLNLLVVGLVLVAATPVTLELIGARLLSDLLAVGRFGMLGVAGLARWIEG